MAESSNSPPPVALEKLLDDMLRDGWLTDMGVESDLVYARMDFETGLYNREHFDRLVDRAIEDVIAGVKKRDREDGPATGQVAVLAVRIVRWDEIKASQDEEQYKTMVTAISDAMKASLRVDDILGRTSPDTFSLLLRACPSDMLQSISERCLKDVAEMRVATDSGWVTLEANTSCAEWIGQGATALVDQAVAGL